MNYLLDTHTFLWFLEGNINLSSKARKIIENPNNTNYISIASIWEVAIKMSLEKLKLDIKLEELKTEILKIPLIELYFLKLFLKNAQLFLKTQISARTRKFKFFGEINSKKHLNV
jgi:PIN domain nuclease of toxin-antitoxin system